MRGIYKRPWEDYIDGKLWVTEADFRNFLSPGGNALNIDGGTIASLAGVWGPPTGLITLVSGTAAITGITIPYATFAGFIVMIPTAIWTWTAATNIAVAGTTTAASISVIMCYLPSTAKWYPSRVA